MLNIVISNSSDLPLYEQIVSQLRKSIMNGEIEGGESLPSIRSMAAELSISVITTKRAYDELEKEGLIVTIPGKGCFAADNNSMLRERRLRLLEELLSEVIKQADYLNLDINEIKDMLQILKEEN